MAEKFDPRRYLSGKQHGYDTASAVKYGLETKGIPSELVGQYVGGGGKAFKVTPTGVELQEGGLNYAQSRKSHDVQASWLPVDVMKAIQAQGVDIFSGYSPRVQEQMKRKLAGTAPESTTGKPTEFQTYFKEQKAAGRSPQDILRDNPFLKQGQEVTDYPADFQKYISSIKDTATFDLNPENVAKMYEQYQTMGAPQQAMQQQTQSGQYKIQAGDTLTAIAKRYGASIQELMKLNPQIKDPNLIYAGSQMQVPGDKGQGAQQQPVIQPVLPRMPDKKAAGGTGAAPSGDTGIDAITAAITAALQGRLDDTGTGQTPREQLAALIEKRTGQLDTLKQYESQAGLPDLRKRYEDFTKQSLDVDKQIEDLPEEMQARTRDFVVNASQLKNITAAESLPLTKLFNSMKRTLTQLNTSIGLSEKTVDRYLDANKADQAALVEAMKLRIESGEKEEEATRNAYKDYLDLLKTRKTLEKKDALGSRDVKDSNGKTYREYFDPTSPSVVVYKKDMGATYKPSSGSSVSSTDYSTTLNQLNDSRGKDTFVNTQTYANLFDNFRTKGKASSFRTNFPPEEFLNPQDPTARKFFQTPTQAQKGDAEVMSADKIKEIVTQYRDAGWDKADVETKMMKDLGVTSLPGVYARALDEAYPAGPSWFDKLKEGWEKR